jgi:hypothetical protein
MLIRVKLGIRRPYESESRDFQMPAMSGPIPRLWMVLLISALPLFFMGVDFFEKMERSGPMGAVIADTLLPASSIGYLMLIYVLKKRKI